MANVSKWKDFEREVAEVLGGRRRHRTTEDFGKSVSDVYWKKLTRKRYPTLSKLAVECKKRNYINVHGMYAEAYLKYGLGKNKRIILATRIVESRATKGAWLKLQKRLAKRVGVPKDKVKIRGYVSSLVTVDLGFFGEMFWAWLYSKKEKLNEKE